MLSKRSVVAHLGSYLLLHPLVRFCGRGTRSGTLPRVASFGCRCAINEPGHAMIYHQKQLTSHHDRPQSHLHPENIGSFLEDCSFDSG